MQRPTNDPGQGGADARPEQDILAAVADATMGAERPATTLPLAGGQRLELTQVEGGDLLRLRGPEGGVRLAIVVTAEGIRLELDGAGLDLRCAGPLRMSAAQVAIHAEQTLALSSGGDATIDVAGTLTSAARAQEILAERGDVRIRANDDVRIDGERTLVQCDGDGVIRPGPGGVPQLPWNS